MISFRVTIPIKMPLSSMTGTKFWFIALVTRSSILESMGNGLTAHPPLHTGKRDLFGLLQIQREFIFQGPEEIALGNCTDVLALAVDDRNGCVAAALQLLQPLPHGKILVEIRYLRLRFQKK